MGPTSHLVKREGRVESIRAGLINNNWVGPSQDSLP